MSQVFFHQMTTAAAGTNLRAIHLRPGCALQVSGTTVLATRCKEIGCTCAEHMPWNGLQSRSEAQVNFRNQRWIANSTQQARWIANPV